MGASNRLMFVCPVGRIHDRAAILHQRTDLPAQVHQVLGAALLSWADAFQSSASQGTV